MSNMYKEYEKYIESNRKVLLEAARIKASPEHKKALHYFRMQKQRGNIKEYPCEENGYKIVR